MILFDYLVWCDCDGYYEPEGTVFFDHTPQTGEGMVLCDGRVWQVSSVNQHSMELHAKQPEVRY